MFAGFNLQVDQIYVQHIELGRQIYSNNQKQVELKFNEFIRNDGSIDGTGMQDNWFPQIKADVFISHSHKDQDKAIALAGWLYGNFNLDVFIDSCVWGYANHLLKKIDEKYCKDQGTGNYIYEKRNNSTSHVHMMLSTALTMMIDNAESLIFLNTPNALNSDEIIKETKSPWIYYELGISKLIRKRKPVRSHGFIKKGMFNESAKELVINYAVDIDHLQAITIDDLSTWHDMYLDLSNNVDFHPLDLLYLKHGIVEVPQALSSKS